VKVRRGSRQRVTRGRTRNSEMGRSLNRDKSIVGRVLNGIRCRRGCRKGRDKVSSNITRRQRDRMRVRSRI
jgi:hypothetical protein